VLFKLKGDLIMKNTKRNLIVCCAAILCIMVIAVGCTPKETAKTEEPTAEATEAPIEATEVPETEATEAPEAEVADVPEGTEATADEVTYTDEEVAAAKKIVEDYLTAEKIEAESVENVADYKVENEMKFTVKVKDQEEAKEVVVARADADSEWAIKTEEAEADA
jgi:hypothetical protein